MKERPILLSGDLIAPTLNNSKTQTRRTSGLEFINQDPDGWKSAQIISGSDGRLFAAFNGHSEPMITSSTVECPYGAIGDRLWVRETWAPEGVTKDGHTTRPAYRADGDDAGRWRPSIHMPKALSRILLEITDIRIERLHDITEQDAISEGIKVHMAWPEAPDRPRYQLYGSAAKNVGQETVFDPIFSFFTVWISINGENSVKQNPWVWVVCFKRLR